MLVLSEYDKVFGYFIPSNLDLPDKKKILKGQLAFYLINDNAELITCEYQGTTKLTFDDRNFLSTSELMSIKNDRTKEDVAGLYGETN